MTKKIDILMATYNGQSFVKAQIESILAQSYPHFHLLIRDDGSKDATVSIVQDFAGKYPTQITLLPTEKGLGAKGNFSCLMEHATANYIMFSDQDDVWMQDKIEKTLACMQDLETRYSKETPLLVHTDLLVSDQHLNTISPSFCQYTGLNANSFKSLNRFLTQNVVTGCTMMINRTLLKLTSPIPSNAIMHDWWLALAASAFGAISFIPEPTMHYRQHGSNTIGAKKFSLWLLIQEKLERIQKTGKWLSFEKEPLLPHDLARLSQAESFYQIFQDQLSYKQKEMLKGYLQLENSGIKNRYLILKHRFFKSGFLRNFHRIVWSGKF